MRTITHECPQCSNMEFKELKTMVKAGTVKEFKNTTTGETRQKKFNAGRYRIECTICGHVEMVVSLNPDSYKDR